MNQTLTWKTKWTQTFRRQKMFFVASHPTSPFLWIKAVKGGYRRLFSVGAESPFESMKAADVWACMCCFKSVPTLENTLIIMCQPLIVVRDILSVTLHTCSGHRVSFTVTDCNICLNANKHEKESSFGTHAHVLQVVGGEYSKANG